MASIDTLISDIYTLLESGNYEAKFKLRLDAQDPQSRKGKLRLSQIGKTCPRQIWYEVNMPERGEALDPNMHLKFAYGHAIEAMLLDLAEQAGHSVTRCQEKVTVEGIDGHLDAFIDSVLVDVKSASKKAFGKFETGSINSDDPFGYVGQLTAYKLATGAADAKWLAMCKETGKLALTPLSRTFPVKERIRYLKDIVQDDVSHIPRIDPVRNGKYGNYGLSMTCAYCPFKRICWPELRVFKYSYGNVYLTRVVKKPQVEEVV